MTYVIAQPCVDVKNGACVEVCPVDCIHTTPDHRQHYIDPEVCIECEQCVLVCPVVAVFLDADLPEEWKGYIEINAAFFRGRKEEVESVPIEKAAAMIRAAHAKAAEIGVAASVAVVDAEGRLLAVESTGGAGTESADSATGRATATAISFRGAERQLSKIAIMAGSQASVVPSNVQPGAMPLIEGVLILGAIAVAGGTQAQDQQICRAGLAAFA